MHLWDRTLIERMHLIFADPFYVIVPICENQSNLRHLRALPPAASACASPYAARDSTRATSTFEGLRPIRGNIDAASRIAYCSAEFMLL
jgi:hypothetical protein